MRVKKLFVIILSLLLILTVTSSGSSSVVTFSTPRLLMYNIYEGSIWTSKFNMKGLNKL